MTSINTSIEASTRDGTLLGVLAAYFYAALLVAGPWIFTVLGLSFLSAATCEGACIDLAIFRSVVIYNSMFALIITSPLAFFTGRYVSEQLHDGRDESVLYALVLSLGLFGVISLASAALFYIFTTTLDDAEKIASMHNAVMIGCSWLLIPFLGALRAHNAVLLAFASGAVSMLVFGTLLHEPQALSLLLVFNLGFSVTNVILLGTIVRRFGRAIVVDRDLGKKLRKNWELPAVGITYALGLWIDKIIMWYVAPSGHLVVAGTLKTMPSYDTAMFWAQLASIPAVAIFFVHVETRFSFHIRLYYERMQKRASLRELKEIIGGIGTHILASMFGLFAALAAIAGLMILLSFAFMNELGLRPAYMSVLRVSLCATTFYTSAMFCSALLLQLDLRLPALQIVGTFLGLNAGLTLALLPFGPDFYGYGNMIAATVSLIVGISLVLKELSWLNYHAFITNNSSR